MPEKLQTLRDKIIQINDDESGSCKQLSVKYLSEIITSRLNEIISACLYMIQESRFADTLRNGVVITGGGAGIPNLSSLVKDMSGYNVRMGYPVHRFSYLGCSEINQKSAVASVGMVLSAKENNWINCLSEAPLKPEPLKKSVLETTEIENPASEEDIVESTISSEEPEKEYVSEETAVIEEIPVTEEKALDSEEIQEDKESREEEKDKKKDKIKTITVKKENIFTRITWKIAKKVGGAVNDAINAGYDSMEDE